MASVVIEEKLSREVCRNPEISFNAFTSKHTPIIIRLEGIIANMPVKILIDGGSTHDFISSQLVQQFKLHIVPSNIFKVMVGNEENFEYIGLT